MEVERKVAEQALEADQKVGSKASAPVDQKMENKLSTVTNKTRF